MGQRDAFAVYGLQQHRHYGRCQEHQHRCAAHQIQIGAQTIDIVGSSTDPIVEPSQTTSNTVYTIGHSAKSTTENFNTYAAFITQLQTELAGGTLATGMTAVGQYTTASYTLEATSVTVFLNN